MNQRDLAVIQGMLDRRHELSLKDDAVALCPYDPKDEFELWSGWYDGYHFHRDPNIADG